MPVVEQQLAPAKSYCELLRGAGAPGPLASRAGEQEAGAGEQHADELSRLQRPGFRSQKAKTVDERRDDGNDEEIEDEGLRGTKLGRDKGEAATMNAPIMPPTTTFHPWIIRRLSSGSGRR